AIAPMKKKIRPIANHGAVALIRPNAHYCAKRKKKKLNLTAKPWGCCANEEEY
ncbi:hypothetical protein CEXT_496231, partial [Caerostris extrusa]